MNNVRILQYNTQKSKDGAQAQAIDGLEEFDIIAIQEPWLNPSIRTTYNPRNGRYHLIYPKEGRARTCIYINKAIPTS